MHRRPRLGVGLPTSARQAENIHWARAPAEAAQPVAYGVSGYPLGDTSRLERRQPERELRRQR